MAEQEINHYMNPWISWANANTLTRYQISELLTFHLHIAWCGLTAFAKVTSSNVNIFHIVGPLWGEPTCHRWIPLTKSSAAKIWCFLWSPPEQTVEPTIETPVICYTIALIMTSWHMLYEQGPDFREWNAICTTVALLGRFSPIVVKYAFGLRTILTSWNVHHSVYGQDILCEKNFRTHKLFSNGHLVTAKQIVLGHARIFWTKC